MTAAADISEPTVAAGALALRQLATARAVYDAAKVALHEATQRASPAERALARERAG